MDSDDDDDDNSLFMRVFTHLEQMSLLKDYESIRCLICAFTERCIFYLYDTHTQNQQQQQQLSRNNSTTKSTSKRSLSFLMDSMNNNMKLKCIQFMIHDILIKRILDKNQTVRYIAIQSLCQFLTLSMDKLLTIRSSSSSKSCTNDTDDDIHMYEYMEEYHSLWTDCVTKLNWTMAHDPSYVNRSVVIKSMPIELVMKVSTTMTTMSTSSSTGSSTGIGMMEIMDSLKHSMIETIAERVRDEKVKVRVDALDVLRSVNVAKDLSVEMRCNILRHGLSTRYPATYAAATKMLCCGWMKTMKFNPIALIQLLNPTSSQSNESIAESVARAIISTAGVLGNEFGSKMEIHNTSSSSKGDNMSTFSSPMTLMDLSDAEVREFKRVVMNCESIDSTSTDTDTGNDEGLMDSSTVIYLRVMYEMILSSKSLTEVKKSNLMMNIVPDVTVLGTVLERHMNKLNSIRFGKEDDEGNSIGDDDDDEICDELCFVCIHLLKLANVLDVKEEGSRRHLSSIIHRVLCSLHTHDELIEGCVHLLATTHDSEASFLRSISEVLTSIVDIEEENNNSISDDERRVQYLRAIEILSITFEKISRRLSKNAILINFSRLILTTITDPSLGSLVREAGVSCLGRFVILMDEEIVIDKYKPLLTEIAFREDEKIEIRAQALLAMCDLGILFERSMAPLTLESIPGEDITISISDILLNAITKSKKSLVIVAAECAAKLMFAGRLHDANILSILITIYFDQNFCSDNLYEDSDDVKEVGSPARLQQLLTLFFPAYSIKSPIGKDTLLTSITPLLDVVHEKMSTKAKGKKITAWPIVKMIEYVLHLVEKGEENQKGNESPRDEASPILVATLAISSFLLKEASQLTTTQLRNLCKIMGKSYIDISSDEQAVLKLLKDNIDELSMHITDNTALRSIESLVVLLDDVPSDDESEVQSEIEDRHDEASNNDNNNYNDECDAFDSHANDSKSFEADSEADEESHCSDSTSQSIRDDDSPVRTNVKSFKSAEIDHSKEVSDIASSLERIGMENSSNSDDAVPTRTQKPSKKVSSSSNHLNAFAAEVEKHDDALPLFATIGQTASHGKKGSNLGSISSRIVIDDDLPLFASIGGATARSDTKKKPRKRIIIESSDESETESDESESVGESDDSYSD